jgi:hypothetical protein
VKKNRIKDRDLGERFVRDVMVAVIAVAPNDKRMNGLCIIREKKASA